MGAGRGRCTQPTRSVAAVYAGCLQQYLFLRLLAWLLDFLVMVSWAQLAPAPIPQYAVTTHFYGRGTGGGDYNEPIRLPMKHLHHNLVYRLYTETSHQRETTLHIMQMHHFVRARCSNTCWGEPERAPHKRYSCARIVYILLLWTYVRPQSKEKQFCKQNGLLILSKKQNGRRMSFEFMDCMASATSC